MGGFLMIRKWAPWNLALATAAILGAAGAVGWVSRDGAELPKADAAVQAEAQQAVPGSGAKPGLYVYLDKDGNRIVPPKSAIVPAPKSEESGSFTKTPLPGGGYKIDVSNIRAYEHASVDESGKVSTTCDIDHDHERDHDHGAVKH